MEFLKITSPAFVNGEIIPDKYTVKGQNINPELIIEDIPLNVKTIAIIVDDPDGHNWVHWVIFNIPANLPITVINENTAPGIEGLNDFKKNKYGGPCPPFGAGYHRYYFKVFALDSELKLDFATRDDLEIEMKGHIIAKGELMGKFKR